MWSDLRPCSSFDHILNSFPVLSIYLQSFKKEFMLLVSPSPIELLKLINFIARFFRVVWNVHWILLCKDFLRITFYSASKKDFTVKMWMLLVLLLVLWSVSECFESNLKISTIRLLYQKIDTVSLFKKWGRWKRGPHICIIRSNWVVF